ncbi:MAG TPA: alpha-amylase family glycosyl hydrolase [Terriglobales bacterium]|nr:alpha-amylase family glycosyl hydrolase [Terriglobales bacterium]
MFEFHVSRAARDRYGFDDSLFSLSGNTVFANLAASREFAHRMNQARDVDRHPERAIQPGALNAMGLIDEALHAIAAQYRRANPGVMEDALHWAESHLGENNVERTLLAFVEHFPPVDVYRERVESSQWLEGTSDGVPNREVVLEELLLLWLANLNSAFQVFKELFDDAPLTRATSYPQLTSEIPQFFSTLPGFGPGNKSLIDLLRAPALASPDSLEGQLAYIRDNWTTHLGDLFRKMLTAMDVLKEEQMAVWMRFHPPAKHLGGAQLQGDSSTAAIPHFTPTEQEYERFSPDLDWMPRTVVIAKSVYVWLDQLAKTYKREVRRLDQVPDEELALMARRGFNGLWLIGVWERSQASQRIKQMCGNPEAAASAYSLFDYVIANDLGGEAAYGNLRDRAWARGIRLASDMVPNHMGIDSRWMIEHPEWFIQLPYSPFPAYSFSGPDVDSDGRVEIKIEDHYFNRTDAAVVFRRRDRWSGDTCYIYHGNDGTSFPWNDTAQLNYLNPEVREAVIQTILHVARMFPIIRFDAAMTLTKRHYQRLWFPEPGTGGAIPSRAEHGLTKPQFDAAMPVEFWREVVDRVSAEAPNTLLLAEAFWLMEGYFVRTLGMHRVYNSAFMNMLRDEENANYRSVIKNTLSFDPEILKRYVNFMNNPDERTAVDQFGKGDKYFGICTMMATLPGLPMFGHGQIEGYTERYGMEYRRAYHDEQPDSWLVARHERQISPLLHRRYIFAEVKDFLLYDFFTDHGSVSEDVFSYSNRSGDERALVVFNNRYSSTRGWVRMSSAYSEKTPDGVRHLKQRTLGDSFGLSHDCQMYAACRDAITGLEFLHRSRDLAEKGINLELHAYQCLVFLDWRDLREDAAHPWGQLCDMLAGRGVSSLEDELRDFRLRPVCNALNELIGKETADALAACETIKDATARQQQELEAKQMVSGRGYELLEQLDSYLSASMPGGGVRPVCAAHEQFVGRLESVLELQRSYRWPASSGAVIPLAAENPTAAWSTILAWDALEAMGSLLDAARADHSSVHVFDDLRLRGILADAFAGCGLEGEEKWRAAARIRASFAHASRSSAPYSWIHDPDVAWVIGVHEHEGATFVNKEEFEKLLWWMAMRNLLELARRRRPGAGEIAAIEDQIKKRMETLEQAGFRVEALEDSLTAPADEEKAPLKR